MIVRIAFPFLLVVVGCVATNAGPPPIVVPVLPPTLPQGIVLNAHRTMYHVFGRDLTSLTANMRASGVTTSRPWRLMRWVINLSALLVRSV